MTESWEAVELKMPKLTHGTLAEVVAPSLGKLSQLEMAAEGVRV